MSTSWINTFTYKVSKRVDIFERKAINKMRESGHLFFFSELIPHFKGKNVFAFATGGSVDNLKNVDRLKDYNVFTVTTAPYFLNQKYGFSPTLWFLHYEPLAQAVMEEEDKHGKIDLSETFIMLPANDSFSPSFFSSPVMKKLRDRHPEASYVLFREHRGRMNSDNLHPEYLATGVEPIRALGGTLEGTFLPICGFLGISNVYFSGVDHLLHTGHFWDRNRKYQSMQGDPIKFPEDEYILKCAQAAKNACEKKGLGCYRLEPEETLLKFYPLIDFEQAIAQASPRITPQSIRDKYKSFSYDEDQRSI